ncbi:molybdopterin-synthase adenylyltransferase MoeB [Blastococcus sp. CCUG 61487]|uniref:molybdopterin-synthase adenylyltransferase MoeB n=1 Tax=Blastococcus sp. CCUG 61487 TaxID=1840703 RepID=UPI0010C099B2|nr:molybdopterin-synthase adenylyltransferase MoeB [Blastococcus sp. CCUG 61487]TKJ34886.1 hypothetical protein A6V29_14750 [Blastococcus sp. CCUG 61487]
MTTPKHTIEDLISNLGQTLPQVSPEELSSGDELSNVVLFDLREPELMRAGALPGARAVGQRFIELELAQQAIARDAPIVLYCQAGRQSLLALRGLQDLGYSNARSLVGGFSAWSSRGLPVEQPVMLTDPERSRYARHLSLPRVGEPGQLLLKKARVAVVGTGGLGAPIAYYLAAAGVGTLRLIDHDVVDASNLQRQILFDTASVGAPKVEVARKRLSEFNPLVALEVRNEMLDTGNAARLLEGVDIVVDGSDNFETRYAVNQAVLAHRQTLVSASVFQFSGQVYSFAPHLGTPCYACLFPEAAPDSLAPSCSASGVVGALAGTVGMLQVMEVLNIILQIGSPLFGRMLTYNGLKAETRQLSFDVNPSCPACQPIRGGSTEVPAG